MNGQTFLATCAAALYITAQTMGAVIISHVGTNDPTTETPAWTSYATAPGTPGTGVTHLGEPAWKVTDPDGGSPNSMYNYQSLQDLNQTAVFDDPTGWKVRWRVAAENLKTSTGDEAAIWIVDGHYSLQFRLYANGPDADDNASLFLTSNALVLKNNVPTIAARATGFHDFALDYDPGTGVYRVFYDGTLVTDSSETPQMLGSANTATVLRWGGLGGNASDPRDVSTYWSFVELSTGTVPEPSALGLLLAALYPVVWRKR